MKILLVNKLYAPDIGGGAELVLANLAAGMQARGHTTHIATTTAGARVVTDEIAGVPVTRVPLKNLFWHLGAERRGPLQRLVWHARDRHNAAMGASLGRVIQRFDPDVVAFHNLAGFSSAAWDAAFAQGKPTIQVLHDYYNLCPRSQLFSGGRNCGAPCVKCRVFRHGRAAQSQGLSAVIGVSQAILDTHVRHGLFAGVPLRRVINNARPVGAPEPRALPPTAATFGFIGTLAAWKGIGQLLEAFLRVADEPGMPALRLRIAGQGEAAYEAALRARFAGSPRIEFLGRVAPESFYRGIDVSVVPSLWHDPLPSVVFESLLFGVPVIGSRRGGIPEMIADRANGLLYEPEDPGALESCIRRLAIEPGLLRRYGQGAVASASHYAGMDRVVDEHLEVCEKVVCA